MALTTTAIDLQIVFTDSGNAPTAGDITKGGVVLVTDAGKNFIGLYTSTDGTDVVKFDSMVSGDIVNDLTTGGTTVPLSAEQGKELKALIDAISSPKLKTY
jgi:hypothetical protein